MLNQLLIAHAPASVRDWHRAVWTFDARMRDVLLHAQEPMLAQIRFAWWRENVEAGGAGARDPLLLAVTQEGERAAHRAELTAIIDGWEALIGLEDAPAQSLTQFARLRGAGVFRALGADAEGAQRAGPRWALWNTPASLGPGVATDALALASAFHPPQRAMGRALPKTLRVLSQLTEADLVCGQLGPASINPRLYLRLWRALLTA